MKKYPFVVRVTIYLAFFFLLIYGLIVARNFLYPLAFGALFAYLLFPVANFFEKKLKFPRILANLVSIIFGIIVLSLAVSLLSSQLGAFAEDFPEMKEQAIRNIENMQRFFQEKTGIGTMRADSFLKNIVQHLFASGGEILTTAFAATTSTIVKIGLLPVYVFLFLYYRTKLKMFVLQIVSKEQHRKAEKIIDEISTVAVRYMSGIVIVVGILCVLNSLGLMIVGLKYPILLGVISAIFNFIPYFGTLIGALVPLFMAILTESSPKYALGVIVLFVIIQFTENNILTPNIVGGQVRLNPFVIILSLIAGSMIWGVPGMFVVVPFMAMFKIICENEESLKAYAFLIGPRGTEKHSLTLDKIKRLFRK